MTNEPQRTSAGRLWTVLIKSEIPNTTGMVWPLSSDKWKAPLDSETRTTAWTRFSQY